MKTVRHDQNATELDRLGTDGQRTSPPVYRGDPVYHGDRDERFSLLVNLARFRTTSARSPSEDQLTVVLAWLCDLSPTVALALARLLLDGDAPALEALGSGPLRVQTQVQLPPLNAAGALRPDISFAAPERALQLLVEAKLDAPFSTYKVDGSIVEQPEAYLKAWERCDPELEAHIQRVATITLHGKARHASDPRRARDVTWTHVLDLLNSLLNENKVEVEARAVARDVVTDLEMRLLPPEAGELDNALKLVTEVARRLQAAIPSSRLRADPFTSSTIYVQGEQIDLNVEGQPLTIWVAFTPARSSFNVRGWRDVLQLWVYPVDGTAPNEKASADLRRAGFDRLRCLGSAWKPYRSRLDWEGLQNHQDPIARATTWAQQQIEQTGWIKTR
jgi:hypothetical protein